jgi:hypothetical protein
VYKEFGGIGVVCANAGVTEIGKVLGDEFEDDGGLKKPNLKTLEVDLVGTIYCTLPIFLLFPSHSL